MTECEALFRFEESIDNPRIPLVRWPYDGAREPAAHQRWRHLAGIVRRFQLYADAGLPALHGMTTAYFEIQSLERRAYAEWLTRKHKIEMDFLSGRRKHCPPWSGC